MISVGPSCCPGGITGYGAVDSGVFIVGISPGKNELLTGRPMTGPAGKLTDNILKACGWSREKTYATNIVCTENQEPSLPTIMQCRPRLFAEVREFKPKLLVLLGKTVGELFFPDRKFGNVRGVLDYYAPWGVHVLPTYHPASILHNAGERVTRDIIRDFSKIAQFFDTPPNPEVKFQIITELNTAQAILNILSREASDSNYIAIDVETHLDKDVDDTVLIDERVVCFSISDGLNTWWFPGELITQLEWPLNLNWTFHHGMFDTVALAEAIGVMLPIKHDTMYMSYCLDERGGYHALKTLARENEAAGFYEEHPTAKKWADKLADLPWLQRYNSRDSAYTARIAERLYDRILTDTVTPFDRGHETGSLLDVYNKLLIPGANVYRLMQQRGIYIDVERYTALLREYVPMREACEEQLRDLTGRLGGDVNMNFASPKQLGAFLYGTLRLPGGPSTAAPILEALENIEGEGAEFIAALIDLRHIDKVLNTYMVGAWDDIRKTRRIHPHPGLHSQVTGRVSYSPYAANTLPRETNDNPYLAKVRWMFTAPSQDHVILLIDFKQAEIYSAWLYCQDKNMWDDLQSGDFHRSNASYIYGIPKSQVTSGQRSDAKRTTFGAFFGIGDAKLAKQTDKTLIETRVFKEAWRDRYPGYVNYTKSVVNEAKATGELTTIPGRKRRFPIITDDSFVNQAINYKIQSTSHDYLLASIIEMFNTVVDMGGYPILDLHDAVAIEAPKQNALEIARYAIEIMRKSRFGVGLSVPAELKMGYSLGEAQDTLI